VNQIVAYGVGESYAGLHVHGCWFLSCLALGRSVAGISTSTTSGPETSATVSLLFCSFVPFWAYEPFVLDHI
jgi:hypothetical protein